MCLQKYKIIPKIRELIPKIAYSRRQKRIDNSPDFDKFVSDNQLTVDGKIVLLTKNNAKIVENLIQNDPEYFPFAQIIFRYYGFKNIKKNASRSLFAVIREIVVLLNLSSVDISDVININQSRM